MSARSPRYPLRRSQATQAAFAGAAGFSKVKLETSWTAAMHSSEVLAPLLCGAYDMYCGIWKYIIYIYIHIYICNYMYIWKVWCEDAMASLLMGFSQQSKERKSENFFQLNQAANALVGRLAMSLSSLFAVNSFVWYINSMMEYDIWSEINLYIIYKYDIAGHIIDGVCFVRRVLTLSIQYLQPNRNLSFDSGKEGREQACERRKG